MKTTIVALSFLCFLCARSASAQLSAPVLSNIPSPMRMVDHPEHASEHALAQESTLFGNSPYTYAQGEVPLADLGSPVYQTPLGDIARVNKKEHITATKAIKVLEQ